MKNRKIFLYIFFALCICASFLSCRAKVSSNADGEINLESSKKRVTIGYSIDTLAIERWRRDSDVFLNTAKELGADVIVQNAGNKVETQIKQLEYLIERKVDVIVIVPKKADSLTETVKKARLAGIPVISYDRLILNADINLYMTVNSFKVGKLMAENLFSVRSYGNWYCIYGPEEDFNMTFIRRGVESVISGKPVNIGYVYYTDGWNYDLSYEKMVQLLSEGKTPDAIIAGNDAVADSIIRAIAECRPGKIIPIVGQDADIAACQNIVSGKQYATIYKPISELAKKSAEAAVALSQGITAEEYAGSNAVIDNGYGEIPVVWLDPVAVTKSNIDEVIIKSGFHTHDEIYH